MLEWIEKRRKLITWIFGITISIIVLSPFSFIGWLPDYIVFSIGATFILKTFATGLTGTRAIIVRVMTTLLLIGYVIITSLFGARLLNKYEKREPDVSSLSHSRHGIRTDTYTQNHSGMGSYWKIWNWRTSSESRQIRSKLQVWFRLGHAGDNNRQLQRLSKLQIREILGISGHPSWCSSFVPKTIF